MAHLAFKRFHCIVLSVVWPDRLRQEDSMLLSLVPNLSSLDET